MPASMESDDDEYYFDPADFDRYPDPQQVDEKKVMSVQSDSFLSYMADKLRRQALGVPDSEVEGEPFTREEIKETLPLLLDQNGPYSPEDVFQYAARTPFECLPVGTQGSVLDKLFGLWRPGEQFMDLVSIHILHTLSKLGDSVDTLVRKWLASRPRAWDRFTDFELQSFPFREDVKNSINCPWDPDAYQLPQAETNIAVQAATTCVSCFEFLVRRDIITAEGYDLNGKSFLAWALEKKCQPVVDLILTECTFGSLVLEAMMEEMNLLDERNPLLLVIEHRNLAGFQILIKRLTAGADEGGVMDRATPLLELLNLPRYKLLLCSFVPAEMADFLLETVGVNIGDVVYNEYTGEEEEEGGEKKEGEEGEGEEKMEEEEEEEEEEGEVKEVKEVKEDEDNEDGENEEEDSKFDYRPITSSWHEAARYNPDPLFMEWLDINSGSCAYEVYNKQGLTPLMYAAYGENAAAFEWLMENCKLSATLATRPESKAWPVIKIIAQNFSYDSDIMFTKLLKTLPPTFFSDLEAVSDVFGYIIDGLWSRGFNPKDPNPQPNFPQGRILTMYLASTRCQQLINRVTPEWTHSREQYMITTRARSYGYSFLPANMIEHRPNEEKRRKPERLPKNSGTHGASYLPARKIHMS